MKVIPRKNVDRKFIVQTLNSEALNKRVIEKMKADLLNVEQDPMKTERLIDGECISCYYLNSGIGTSNMIAKPCKNCDKIMMFGSSYINRICNDCAKKLSLCKRCLGRIEL